MTDIEQQAFRRLVEAIGETRAVECETVVARYRYFEALTRNQHGSDESRAADRQTAATLTLASMNGRTGA